MKFAYIYNPKHLNISAIRNNEEPTDYGYGAFELEELGHTVDFFEMKLWDNSSIPSKFVYLLSRYLIPLLTLNTVKYQYFIEALRLLKNINGEHDVIFSIPQKMTVALSLCKRLGFVRPEIYGIQTGVVNRKYSIFQRLILSFLFRAIHSIVLGECEHKEMKDRCFMKNNRKIHFIPFGVDDTFWMPDNSVCRQDYILSVGSDHYRDFNLLVEVAKRVNYQFVILTNLEISKPYPSNIKIIKGSTGQPAVTFFELREMYRKAACLITPVKDCFQPSGQSSTLQAMACGTPVIVANYKGLWSREQIVDMKSALLYEVNNTHDCLLKINIIFNDILLSKRIAKNAQKIISKHTTSTIFTESLIELCESKHIN